MLVGNKVDLVENDPSARQFAHDHAAEFELQRQLLFREADAAVTSYGHGVEERGRHWQNGRLHWKGAEFSWSRMRLGCLLAFGLWGLQGRWEVAPPALWNGPAYPMANLSHGANATATCYGKLVAVQISKMPAKSGKNGIPALAKNGFMLDASSGLGNELAIELGATLLWSSFVYSRWFGLGLLGWSPWLDAAVMGRVRVAPLEVATARAGLGQCGVPLVAGCCGCFQA